MEDGSLDHFIIVNIVETGEMPQSGFSLFAKEIGNGYPVNKGFSSISI